MFESDRLLHGGSGLVAGDGMTARTATRVADGEREGFMAGRVEELRRMASVLMERLALVERDSLRLARETERDAGTTGKLAAAQDTLADLHGLDPRAFEQAATFASSLLRVTQETERPSSAVFGETNGGSKLTEAAVLSIRRRHPEGESMEALAREYGVCRGTIKDVIRHRTWKAIGRDDRKGRDGK